jgi:hypothetical protein
MLGASVRRHRRSSRSDVLGPFDRQCAKGGCSELLLVVTLLTTLVFGAAAGMQGPQIGLNQPTPWHGIYERINIGGYLVWMAVLAVALLCANEILVDLLWVPALLTCGYSSKRPRVRRGQGVLRSPHEPTEPTNHPD